MSNPEEYNRRVEDLLGQYLGEAILDALADPDVEEIYVNPDMRLRLVSYANGRQELDARMREADVTQFLRAIATLNSVDIDLARPSLQAVLPRSFGKCRLQGFIPPLSEAPSLIIRKPPNRVIPLEEYVEKGIMGAGERAHIERAVAAGTDDFLSKPVNQVELLKRVETMLRLKDFADENERLRRSKRSSRRIRSPRTDTLNA